MHGAPPRRRIDKPSATKAALRFANMSAAEEADKTAATDASAGDEEEEWLYGGKRAVLLSNINPRVR